MHKPNTITIEKTKYVLIPEAEYHLLLAGCPPLPPADKDGTRDAIAFSRANIARSVVRERLSVGMSQKELAEAAGIRPEMLNRIERGIHNPSYKTAVKIENALVRAGLKRPPL